MFEFNNPYATNPYAVPYQRQQMPTPTQSNNGIVWVNGIDEANQYLVAPNTAIPLWDRSGNAIYLKSADNTGFCSMKILDVVERKNATETIAKDSKEFVRLEDFNALRTEFEALKEKVGNDDE